MTPPYSAPADRRFVLWLLAILAIALSVRAGYIITAKRGEPLLGDAIYYSAQADTIAEGRWFKDPYRPEREAADHPPMTALALAPASILPGDSLLAHRLTMAILGTAAVAAIGAFGRVLVGGRGGLISAGLAAVYPNLWVNDAVAMSEALAALAVASFLLVVYRYLRNPSIPLATSLGAIAGFAGLVRGELLLLLPLVALPAVVRAVPGRRVRHLAVVALVGTAMQVPWVAYNAARFERRPVLSTNDGLTLLGANCPPVYESGAIGFWALQCADLDQPGDQSEVSARYRAQAVAFARDNATRLPIVVAARVGRVWSIYEPGQMVWYNQGEGREPLVSWLGVASYWAMLPLAVLGALTLRRRRVPLAPLLAMPILVTLVAALFYGLVRFRVPAEVVLVVLAAAQLEAVNERLRRWGRGPALARSMGLGPHAGQ